MWILCRKGLLTIVAVSALWSLPAHAYVSGTANGPEVSWWRVVLAFFLCCGLGLAGALALKYRLTQSASKGIGSPLRLFEFKAWQNAFARFNTTRTDTGNQSLKLLETVHLNHQVEVNLLSCDGEKVLIVTSPQGAFAVGYKANQIPGDAK